MATARASRRVTTRFGCLTRSPPRLHRARRKTRLAAAVVLLLARGFGSTGANRVEESEPMPSPLPIDPLLPSLLEALSSNPAVVVEAAPGAGKTTRIPAALLRAPRRGGGEIWVAEPRRVAARLAAHRVAEELGQAVGEEVGYQVRFEQRGGPHTRLRFVTEGVLSQRLADGTAAPPRFVVLDEFHERHLATDLNLMLARAALAREPEMRLIVMSATLDGEAIATYLGGCPRLRAEGRSFPIAIYHEAEPSDRPLPSVMASAVKRAAARSAGNILAFLPGTGEIRDCLGRLEGFGRHAGWSVLPLSGEMPLAAQALAIGASEQRKIVLATNVAESSVTVHGVTTVIDSGLARIAEHSPWTGRPALVLREVSQASAVQRAGRAGRTAPGEVYRLYGEASFQRRPAFDKPEVQRLELAELLLELLGAGVGVEPEAWLDAPPPQSLRAALDLLQRLDLASEGSLTPLGELARRLPLPPRQSRLLLEGERLGVADQARLAAAILSERDPRLRDVGRAGEGHDCDLHALMSLVSEASERRYKGGRLRTLGLDPARTEAIVKSNAQLARARRGARVPRAREQPALGEEEAFAVALLKAFPDRVAKRRAPGSPELILATGQVARLSPSSVAQGAQLLIAAAAEERRSALLPGAGGIGRRAERPHVSVTIASPIQPDWLLDHFPQDVGLVDELRWDADKEAVTCVSQVRWGAVLLEESSSAGRPSPEAAALLQRAARAQLANLFGKKPQLGSLLARAEILAEQFPSLGLRELAGSGVEGVLALACEEATSLAELRQLDWSDRFLARLTHEQAGALHRHTPAVVQLPGRRNVPIRYEPGKPPGISSRLQDFFGLREGPRICDGRLPLTLELLAPNRRAVQITTDLESFWERHYPAIRKELRRRYPRHAWPEDPYSPAEPPKARDEH